MKDFELYLKDQGMKPSTVAQHCKYASYFLSWLSKESLTLSQVSYAEILDYTDQLKAGGSSTGYTNRNLLSVQYYFSHLKTKDQNTHNPTAGIRLKGTLRTIPHNLLEKSELESLYESYEVKDDRSQRNKVMLSLLIYQGITNQELHKLGAGHIKLKEGKLYIPASEQRNSRTLKLEAFQVMELYEYIHVTRLKILAERSEERSGRKPKVMKPVEQIQQLFISMNGCEDIKNSLYHFNQAKP